MPQPAPPPRHLRARPRRLSVRLRWLLLAALTVPLVAGVAVAGPGERPAQAAPGSPAATAVRYALAQLGKPYRWGAEGPNSFDCSGSVQTAYRAAGINLPRVSRQQYGAGRLVPLTAPRPGDLLFYARDVRDRWTIYHVGMYLGAGSMVEAPNPRAPVRIAAARRPGLLARATRPAPGQGMLPVQFGERGKAVATVQQRLAANRVRVSVDGDFGPMTRRVVVAFPRAHGLAADGVVGPRTRGALVTSAASAAPPGARALLSSAACETEPAARWSPPSCGPTGSTRPSACPGRASWPCWTPCTTGRPG